MRTKCVAILLGLGALLLSAPAAAEKKPYAKPDDTWISIGGTVESVAANSFVLDYGAGEITVEMDDGDRDADAYKLLLGDKVRVNGIIDDDFYETAKIEAASVYVEKLGTHFYSSSLDEEDGFVAVGTPLVVVGETRLRGIVSSVGANQFTLDTGVRELTVEVDEMPYDPLDDEGFQKVEVGDTVSVTGEIDEELFEGRVLEADSVIAYSS